MSQETVTEPLTGKALLKKLKEIPEMKRTDKARACGYIVTKQGKSKVLLSEFMTAILEAKGIEVDPTPQGGSRGREANYKVAVHQNGNIVIGKSYTQKMGLQAGDEFTIKLGYKHIQLQQIDGDEAADED